MVASKRGIPYNKFGGDTMNIYAAILIDIENSKAYQVGYRNALQDCIYSCSKKLNEIFVEQLEYEVRFCGGDALQGLFRDPVAAMLYFRLLEIMILII